MTWSLDEELDFAINEKDLATFTETALVRYPEALLRLREAKEIINVFRCEAGDRERVVIQQIKQLAYADGLAQAVDAYIKAEVKEEGQDQAAETLLLAVKAYKASREVP